MITKHIFETNNYIYILLLYFKLLIIIINVKIPYIIEHNFWPQTNYSILRV